MCGIGGVIDRTGQLDLRAVVDRIVDPLRSRGPDDLGFHIDGLVGLAHTRLSVIDISDRGHQPVPGPEATTWLVANGEIYNHADLRARSIEAGIPFRSRSDSEVILALYSRYDGDIRRVLHSLEGMFAFALWDSVRQRLVLARDRLGIKPLFVAGDHRRLVFASRVDAVNASGLTTRQVDATSLAEMFATLSIPGPNTAFDDIRHVEPGTALVIDRDGIETIRWWSPRVPRDRVADPGEAGELVSEAVQRAVARQLVADVPVGAFLSGGIDSGVVTGMAAQLSTAERLETFSIAYGSDDDESATAREAAARLGTDHHEVDLRAGFLTDLPQVLAALDQPQAVISGVPLLRLATEARRHVTVVLTGDGGDELFGGYSRHRSSLVPITWLRPLLTGRPGSRRRLGRLLSPFPGRLGRTGAMLARDDVELYLPRLHTLAMADAAALLHPDLRHQVDTERYERRIRWAFEQADAEDELTRRLVVDLLTTLPDEMLTKVDRMTMAVGLEARVPLLDELVVAAALRLAPDVKRSGDVGKLPLRAMARDLLGDQHASLPKSGFPAPFAGMAMNDTRTGHQVEAAFTRAAESPLLDPALAALGPAALAETHGASSVYGTIVTAEVLGRQMGLG